MKLYSKLVLMLVLHTLNASCARHIPKPGDPVFLELILNQKNLSRPHLAIHQENYCDEDSVRTKFIIIYPTRKKGNHYFFELPGQQHLRYFSIVVTENKMPVYLMEDYHFEPGDNIRISTDTLAAPNTNSLDFSGYAAAKYRCQSEFNDQLHLDSALGEPLYTTGGLYNSNNTYSRKRKLLFEVIDKFDPQLSDDSYALLKADVIYKTAREMTADFQERIAEALKNNDLQLYVSLNSDYSKMLRQKDAASIPDKIKYLSKEYAQYYVARQVCDYFSQYMRTNFIGIYNQIYKIKNADLRDKVTVALFIKHYAEMKTDYHSLLDYALSHIRNKECEEKLRYFASLH